MKLVCPSCGAAHSADAWNNDSQARQCLKLVAEMPQPVSRRSLAYLSLFRPRSGRGLQWRTALRILHELSQLAAETHIQWDNRPARPVSTALWGDAIERMLANPPRSLPLKSHNYLRAIVYDLANETDRQAEVRHNQDERSGNVKREETPEWQPSRDDFARLRHALNGVGKKI